MNLAELRRADLNLLAVLVVVWREQSVTRAAKELNVSQAAVSAALGRLRRLFDDPLFVRTRSGMIPTARGGDIIRQVEPSLRSLHRAIWGTVRFDPSSSDRRFSIGLSDDIEAYLMPDLVRHIQARSPGLSLIARQTNRYLIGGMLDAGEIDLGIAVAPVLRAQHRQETLFTSGYQCLFDGGRLGLAAPLSLEEYLDWPHVLVSFDGRRGIVDDLLDARGLHRRVLCATTHFSGVIVMLKAVDAIATIPEHAATVFARAANLTVSPPPIHMPRFSVSLVWHSASGEEIGSTWLRRQVRSAVEAMNVAESESPHQPGG